MFVNVDRRLTLVGKHADKMALVTSQANCVVLNGSEYVEFFRCMSDRSCDPTHHLSVPVDN